MKATDNLMKSSTSRPPSYSWATLPSPSNHLRARVINRCVRDVHRYKRGLLTGKTRHAILLTQGLALTVRIDLGDSNLVFSVSKRIREFFVLGCEVFAVTAIMGMSLHRTVMHHGLLCDIPPRGKAKMV